MWIKLDDHFDQHRKMQKIGPLGIALWVCGLAYCNRNLSDGIIPWASARTLLSLRFLDPRSDDERGSRVWDVGLGCGMSGMDGSEALEETIEILVAAGVWDRTADGYAVHDYLDYQPSRNEVLRERSRGAQRQARYRDAHSNGVTNAISNGLVTSAPYPVSRTRESKKEPIAPSADADFSVVWNAYPKNGPRSRKAEALRVWKRLTPKPILAEVLEGLARCCASDDWCREGGRFVPGIQVWLRQRGWDCADSAALPEKAYPPHRPEMTREERMAQINRGRE